MLVYCFFLRLAMQTVDDDGEGAVAGYVAGRAEGVHGDVEGDDEGLGFGGKTQHARQGTEGCHGRSAGNAWSRHHADGQQQDEMEKERQAVRQSADETDGQRATGNLHHRTGNMDGGAERNTKTGDFIAHPVLLRLL